MIDDPRPIGVFDSGIGGLSVVKHLMRELPHERFVYLGDTARVPYGNRSKDTVRQYARECTDFLLQHNVKLIVVACNTVSAIALDDVNNRTDLPVVNMIDPASKAAASSANNVIGIIGTRATINSEAYSKAILKLNKSASVHSKACPLFVPLVEEGWIDSPATASIAAEYLRSFREFGVHVLVLGCTHYPLLRAVIEHTLPGVELVDCGDHATKEVVNIVGRSAEPPQQKGSLDLYVTDVNPTFSSLAQSFLGQPVADPTVVTLSNADSIGVTR